MTEKMRALIASQGSSRGVLAHLLVDGAEHSLCGAFATNSLVVGVRTEEICPACLEHLRMEWLKEPSHEFKRRREDAPSFAL
jgi:hypothetical protein